jgi:hypothetical protein
MESKKVYKKDANLSADGSVNPHLHPADFLKEQDDDDDARPQVCVRAEKKEEGQDVGVTFKKVGENVYVSGIASDSIFLESGLELGDRICSVNDTNFMSYADATFASKLLNKKKVMEGVMYVEKGWDQLNIPGDVDTCHFDTNPGKPKPKPKPKPAAAPEPKPEPEPKKKEEASPPPPKKKEEPGVEKMWWDE